MPVRRAKRRARDAGREPCRLDCRKARGAGGHAPRSRGAGERGREACVEDACRGGRAPAAREVGAGDGRAREEARVSQHEEPLGLVPAGDGAHLHQHAPCALPDGVPRFIVTALVVLGIGLGAFSAPNNNAILSCVDRSHYSEANATVSTMRGIGQTASLAFASTMLSSSLGSTIFSESDPQVLSTAIAQIMFVCFVLSMLTIAASLVRNKRA